jgi:hypothetical protein
MTAAWISLRHEEFQNSYSSTNISREMKSYRVSGIIGEISVPKIILEA